MEQGKSLSEILEAIDFARGLILDAVEAELIDSPQKWDVLRSRILKCLGDRGLQGRIRNILDGDRPCAK